MSKAVKQIVGFTGRIAHSGYLAWLAVIAAWVDQVELDAVSVPRRNVGSYYLLSTSLFTSTWGAVVIPETHVIKLTVSGLGVGR